jgi:protein TonB
MKTTWMWVGLGIALCVTACGDASAPAAGVQEGVLPAGPVEKGAETASATPYERATRALSGNRMLSPAGDNAVEHYLAARAQGAEQARAQAALAELQPYVLIATEQAIARGDAQEASRLQGLIERIDAQTPALPRLRAEVAALVRAQAAQAAQAVAAVEAPPSVAAPAAAPVRAVAAPANAPVATMAAVNEPAQTTAPPPAPAMVAQEEARPPAVPVASRVVQGPRTPRLLQDAQPRYPLPALRARVEGQAEVAFTIQPDGSVRDVRLVSSTAGGMFDASAIAVAQRWRFEATGRAHASSRTVRFRLPAEEARGG